jgi:putative MFS transporter
MPDELRAWADTGAGIAARLDRLPATRTVWKLVCLLSLGGFFEFYDLFFTGYVAPGLVREGILTPTTPGLFGTSGIAGFVAALFCGLFVGTLVFSVVADRLGRRAVFTVSLLWYTAASLVMATQTTAFGLNVWRFIAGIGIGVELVTIDTYLSELVPKDMRGRAFAANHVVQFVAVPVVAFLAWLLVPRDPLGIAGWRWVVAIGAVSALGVWVIRRAVPESPRWMAQHGHEAQAAAVMAALERRVEAEFGAPLPPAVPVAAAAEGARLGDIFRPPYTGRTVMLVIFNIFQTVGFYGFSNWVPQLLISQGVAVTRSLLYTFVIALAAPVGPLLAILVADRVERKWLIVAAAAAVAGFGLVFSQARSPALLIALGVCVTLSSNVMSFSFHAYQAELYPTGIRAMAVGFVYAWSRISVVFSAFVIAFFLRDFGTLGVFAFIAGSMAVVMLAIGGLGPRTRLLSLESIAR